MAQPWDNFGAPDETSPTSDPKAAAPAWDSFGADDTPPSNTLAGNPLSQALSGPSTNPDKPANYDIASDWKAHTADITGLPQGLVDALHLNDKGVLAHVGRQLLTGAGLASTVAQYGMAGIETAANAGDAALSDIGYRTGLNKLLGTDRINPLNTALDIGNALQGDTQFLHPQTAPAVADSTIEQNISDIVAKGGSADDVRAYVKSYGGNPDELKGLDEAIAAHKAGQEVGVAVADNAVKQASETPTTTPVPDNPLAPKLGVETPPNAESAVKTTAVEQTVNDIKEANEPQPVAAQPEVVPPSSQPTGEPPIADTGDLFSSPKSAPPAVAETPPSPSPEAPKPLEQVTPEEADTATQRITQQLEDAFNQRRDQQGLLDENRKAQAARLQQAIEDSNGNDTERLIAMKEALKGKVDRAPLQNIRDQLDPQDVNALQARILNNNDLMPFEKMRSANAFAKLIDGEHLQPAEILLLNKSFPTNLMKGFMKNADDLRANSLRGQGELFKQGETLSSGPIKELNPEEKPVDPEKYVFDKNQSDLFPQTRDNPEKLFPNRPSDKPKAPEKEPEPSAFVKALSLPRSLMATLDLSAPLRQGVFLVGRKEFYPAFASMFKQFGSENAFKAVQQSIEASPNFPLMEKSGLALSKRDGGFTAREEQFSNEWAGKIPIFGQAHKASERAYTGFLNKLRADTFNSLVDRYKAAGIDLSDEANAKSLSDVSRYINNATGRGNLPKKWEAAAAPLSTALFSPRLIASRVNLLNPVEYVKLDPIVRKEAVKSLLAFGGIATTVATLAKAAGADVETDPRSSDFAKIRVGNTRYDMLGGFGQYLTLGARLATGETKNSKGVTRDLTSGGFGQPTRLDVLSNFGLNKAAPVPSFAIDWLRGKDAVGTPFEVKREIASRFIPLLIQDASDVIQDRGVAQGLPMAVPGVFGVGIQTYNNKAKPASATGTPDYMNFK